MSQLRNNQLDWLNGTSRHGEQARSFAFMWRCHQEPQPITRWRHCVCLWFRKTWSAAIISFLNIIDQQRTIDEFNQLLDHRSGQQGRRNLKAPATHSSEDLWRNRTGDNEIVHICSHMQHTTGDSVHQIYDGDGPDGLSEMNTPSSQCCSRMMEMVQHAIFSELFTRLDPSLSAGFDVCLHSGLTEALGTLHVTRWRCCVNIVVLSGFRFFLHTRRWSEVKLTAAEFLQNYFNNQTFVN